MIHVRLIALLNSFWPNSNKKKPTCPTLITFKPKQTITMTMMIVMITVFGMLLKNLQIVMIMAFGMLLKNIKI